MTGTESDGARERETSMTLVFHVSFYYIFFSGVYLVLRHLSQFPIGHGFSLHSGAISIGVHYIHACIPMSSFCFLQYNIRKLEVTFQVASGKPAQS